MTTILPPGRKPALHAKERPFGRSQTPRNGRLMRQPPRSFAACCEEQRGPVFSGSFATGRERPLRVGKNRGPTEQVCYRFEVVSSHASSGERGSGANSTFDFASYAGTSFYFEIEEVL
jgi:hypothetical protein